MPKLSGLNRPTSAPWLRVFLWLPRWRIRVHREPSRVNPPSVYIRGEVARPGRYPLTADMKVTDLLRSAGGLLRSANPDSGDLTHYAVASSSAAANPPSDSHAVRL